MKNEISVIDTLKLLNGKFADVFIHFAQGEYAFWLGSAISKERVIGLDGVLSNFLSFFEVTQLKKMTADIKLHLTKF